MFGFLGKFPAGFGRRSVTGGSCFGQEPSFTLYLSGSFCVYCVRIRSESILEEFIVFLSQSCSIGGMF